MVISLPASSYAQLFRTIQRNLKTANNLLNMGYSLRATILAKGGLLDMLHSIMLPVAEHKDHPGAAVNREEAALLANKRFCALVTVVFHNEMSVGQPLERVCLRAVRTDYRQLHAVFLLSSSPPFVVLFLVHFVHIILVIFE